MKLIAFQLIIYQGPNTTNAKIILQKKKKKIKR